MYTKAKLMFMYAETSLHAGSGTSLSAIDLPIQREKYTNFPTVAGSGVKGAVREWFENSGLHDVLVTQRALMKHCELQAALKRLRNGSSEQLDTTPDANKLLHEKHVTEELQKIKIVFGPEENASEHAGAIAFSDARILLFPVRSMKGVFAYVTCPLVLERLQRDIEAAGGSVPWDVPLVAGEMAYATSEDPTKGTKASVLTIGDQIVLEEFAFSIGPAAQSSKVNDIAKWLADDVFPGDGSSFWQKKVKDSLLILSDDDFKDFVEHSTEVNARIKLGLGKSTSGRGGNLFYEENLPPESVLYSLVLASSPHAVDLSGTVDSAKNIRDYVKNMLNEKRLQLGGDETLGKGIVNIKFL